MSSAKSSPAVAAVVVTYNRLALLKECIQALRNQTRRPEEIIVINNSSTDGTEAWLNEQADLTVVKQPNLGGAGGFHTGIKTAYQKGHDWFWCMDDDTIPHPDALEKLLLAAERTPAPAGFLASLATWVDGRTHVMNIPGLGDPSCWLHTILESRSITVHSASFVSVLVARPAVAKVGLPLAQMYIWCDDFEFTSRIVNGYGPGYLVLDSIVSHNTKSNAAMPRGKVSRSDYPKYKYGARNYIFVLRTRPDLKWYGKFRAIERYFREHVFMALTGRAPVRVLWWCLQGLTFSPRVEFP